MTQQIRDVMTPNPITLPATASALEAAKAMREGDVGDVIVLDGDHLDGNHIVGILTDRDIVVRGVAFGLNPAETSIGEICSRVLTIVSPADEVSDAIVLHEGQGHPSAARGGAQSPCRHRIPGRPRRRERPALGPRRDQRCAAKSLSKRPDDSRRRPRQASWLSYSASRPSCSVVIDSPKREAPSPMSSPRRASLRRRSRPGPHSRAVCRAAPRRRSR